MNTEVISKGIQPWRVKSVSPKEDYTLHLEFVDGSRKIYDFKPLLEHKINEKLKNIKLFMTAHVDGYTVVWTDELDIAPEELYEHGIAC